MLTLMREQSALVVIEWGRQGVDLATKLIGAHARCRVVVRPGFKNIGGERRKAAGISTVSVDNFVDD